MSETGLLSNPEEIRAILVASARSRRSISYSELLSLLGHDFSRPKMRALCKVLALIDEQGEERGEPELAVLVVRQADGLPGQGWWIEGSKKYDYKGVWEGPEATNLIRTVQATTFDHWAMD